MMYIAYIHYICIYISFIIYIYEMIPGLVEECRMFYNDLKLQSI